MRLVLSIPLRPSREGADEDEDAEPRVWRWYVDPASSEEPGSRNAARPQDLAFHLEHAEHFAREIATALGLETQEATAIGWAARFHDLGKRRALWQRSIGNFDPDTVLAKSGDRGVGRAITKYRHELGSLLDLESEPEFQKLTEAEQELVRHAVACHHGRARPCFLEGEVFDPGHNDGHCAAAAQAAARRFAQLQRKYGRWGLAYLESLVRAADVLASIVLQDRDQRSEASE
jgi:CRISPR-associated endonuclease/helicase Cas3